MSDHTTGWVYADNPDYKIADGSFEPTWQSLQSFQCPEWFRDAKLGFWAHWGYQAVPMYGDWYARNMYLEGSDQYRFHWRTYGHPSKFGFKDVCATWKAENFDPDALMQQYQQRSAPVILWRWLCIMTTLIVRIQSITTGTRSTSVQKRTSFGLWKQAATRYGLRFGVTEHLERSYSWLNTTNWRTGRVRMLEFHMSAADSQYARFLFSASW